MRERHQNETRARALATQDRNYWVHLLETVDTWFPVYRTRHPDADRAGVVAHLAKLVDERRRRGFSEQGHEKPPTIPDSALFFETPQALRGFKGHPESIFSTTSGVAKASAFKVFDVENKSKSDTQDQSSFSPLITDTFVGAHAARFWLGFARLDSTWDQVDIFHGSPSDRVVHMAVLQIPLPPPTTKVIASLRTSMFITLNQGAEVIDDWGFFDDQDDASLKIDFCGAFTRNGEGFPDPQAFGFTSAMSLGSSDHHFIGRDADMSRTVVLFPGDKPSLFLGMRWTFAAADSRIQTGFTEHAENSLFGFQRPDTGTPGVLFTYEPEILIAQ